MSADLPVMLASISESSPGLSDLGFYPKILRIFEGDLIVLGIWMKVIGFFQEKSWVKSWEL